MPSAASDSATSSREASPGTVATGHTMTRAIASVGCMLRLLLVYTVGLHSAVCW